MRKITADYIHTVSHGTLEQQVLILDEEGRILAIEPLSQHDARSVEHHLGHIVPGFVNAHCHLELSHMKDMVDTGSGLIAFVTDVVAKREMPQSAIQAAIQAADREMWDNGIMAVGDISNATDTFATKQGSPIRYYTFVEMFDLLQAQHAAAKFQEYKAVFDALELPKGHQKSIVPHAPYSVSTALWEHLQKHHPSGGATISIHNQETPAENQLFLTGQSPFADWYRAFGLDLSSFQATGLKSISYPLPYLNPHNRTLFVHNTLSEADDIALAEAWSDNVYWCTCPNANLYIENRLPDYTLFLEAGSRVCIGTDSLTSNWQLSVLEEMKTIARYQSAIPFATLLQWATQNGAEALGFEDELGSIEPGKRPGLLLLEHFEGKLLPTTQVRRLM